MTQYVTGFDAYNHPIYGYGAPEQNGSTYAPWQNLFNSNPQGIDGAIAQGAQPEGQQSTGNGLFDWIGSVDKSIPFLGGIDSSLGLNPNDPGSITSSTGFFAQAGQFLAIITDIPRMATIVIGLILLIAGLFMLGYRPAVTIATKAAEIAG